MEDKPTASIDRTVLERAAGAGSVTNDMQVLEEYASDCSFARESKPLLVIRPESVEAIERVVKAVAGSGLKLIPVSSGPPHFRGDTVPTTENAVMLDLSGLDEITWINRRNRAAVVNPGVTFGRLEKMLETEGMRCMMPLYPRSNKSVVAAYMEREPFTVPKYSWDLGDPVASSQLTFGDGATLRTGGAAGPGTLEEQREKLGAHKLPFGPIMLDPRKLSQGSNGSLSICNWIALRCELLPEYEKLFFAGADELSGLTGLLYRGLYLKLVDEQYILNSLALASLFETDPAAIDKLRTELPNWILVSSVGGYGKRASAQFEWKEADLNDEAGRLGIELKTEIAGISEAVYREKIVRKSCPDPYWKIRYRGDVRELMFLTSASKTPNFTSEVFKMSRKAGFDPKRIGVYIQMVLQGKACQISFDFLAEPEELRNFESTYTRIAEALFDSGAYYSRPYGPLAGIIYGHEGYETFVKYARGVKEILDPENILNPGKLCF